jgi:hypothetical protein
MIFKTSRPSGGAKQGARMMRLIEYIGEQAIEVRTELSLRWLAWKDSQVELPYEDREL